MPSPTLAAVMDALAAQIRSVVDDVTDVAVQVEPRWVTNPSPPTIDIYPADPSSDPEFRAMGERLGAELLTVRARVDMADDIAAQDILLAFMDDTDPLSITAAIEEDDTLGGVAQTLDVRSRSGYVRFVESGETMGCLWQVVVVKARS
jgi:acyl-CoA thioesterase